MHVPFGTTAAISARVYTPQNISQISDNNVSNADEKTLFWEEVRFAGPFFQAFPEDLRILQFTCLCSNNPPMFLRKTYALVRHSRNPA